MMTFEFIGNELGKEIWYFITVVDGRITKVEKKTSTGIYIDMTHCGDIELTLSDVYKLSVNSQMNTYKRFVATLNEDEIEKYFKIEEVTIPKFV